MSTQYWGAAPAGNATTHQMAAPLVVLTPQLPCALHAAVMTPVVGLMTLPGHWRHEVRAGSTVKPVLHHPQVESFGLEQ